MDLAKLPPLEPLELCSGMVFGRRRTPALSTDSSSSASSVREVLEELLLPALSRPPCLVAFSGGRDSSAVLAMATHVARHHGLDDPVPATLRYEQHPRTWETDWQEMTVRHLGLRHWEVIPLTSELDAVGPIGGVILRHHGLYWPPNAHAMVPLLRAAGDGALITGNGGDEVLSRWAGRRISLFRAWRARPRRRALMNVALSLMPAPLRIRLWLARHPVRLPWLRPTAKQEIQRSFIAKLSNRSPSWRHGLEGLIDSRYLELALGIFGALAREAGVELVEPFFHPRFIRAAADAAPYNGFPSRRAALETHFGDLLPQAAIQRSTKASFTEVLWGPDSRAFSKHWDGSGLDHSLIDPNELRREWSKPCPDFRSLTPLQAAWLASVP